MPDDVVKYTPKKGGFYRDPVHEGVTPIREKKHCPVCNGFIQEDTGQCWRKCEPEKPDEKK